MDIQLLINVKATTVATTRQDITIQRLNEKLMQVDHLFAEGPHSEVLIQTLNTIKKTLNKLSINFNAYQSSYLEELIDEILQANEDLDVAPPKQLEDVLWQCNFNSRPFFLYIIKRINNRLQSEETLIAKMELLAFELKNVNQIVCDHSIRFTEKYPDLHDVVSNWLLEEIAFLRTKQDLLAKPHSEGAITNEFKIALDLSVAQFSCLVRGLMERKLILNTNLTELATFLSSAVVTKRSENISEGSFRRKYYNIEDSTKKSVIEVLNKTIDWLMKS